MPDEISKIVEQAQAQLNSIKEMSATAEAAVTATKSYQHTNKQHSKYIEDAKNHAVNITEILEEAKVNCTVALEKASKASDTATTSAELAEENAIESTEARKKTETARDESRLTAETAKEIQRELQALAAVADSKEAKIKDYEAKLQSLIEKCAAQQKEITRLLPGATSAGLASAYRDRRAAFVKPAWVWQGVFILALLALIILALYGLSDTREADSNKVRELSELTRLWLTRLPIAGALIWLALHAGQEGALARRLEEDYGYKETVAASFQGFQEQMASIENGTDPDSALARLCNDVLSTLAAPPGRIYDKHALTALPSDLVTKMADAVAGKLKPEK